MTLWQVSRINARPLPKRWGFPSGLNRQKSAAIIINAGAYTHTSAAIHDALKTFDGYIIELHISNPHAREEFRHHSWISPVANAVMAGAGAYGYELATRLAAEKIAQTK